ncbi:zinc finger CCHC domain-containing protein 3-like [Latimeria chalumnae]|uniref:zinc finger CCHC domain-containing protein 3-like n=1 Tax=Latimeria chalumnae TaxID=7897 RepID=UPI00313BB666
MEVIENGVGEQKQFEQDGTTTKTRKEDGTNEKDDGNKENRPETRPGKILYSEALRQSDERDSSTTGYRRKNVVCLRFLGEEGKVPDRDCVGKVLIKDSLKFSPLEVFALIQISSTREFDISFRIPVYLERFWQIYEHVKKDSVWQDFLAVKITQADIKTITILFKNESVPASDIYFWLSRKCKVFGDLQPIYDSNGFWIGGYKARIKLTATPTGLQHLPNSITIGSDRGYLFYPGQPQACFKCGSLRHHSAVCPKQKCNHCGQMGHLAKDCNNSILCNLCGEQGHSYLHCKSSVRNGITNSMLTGFTIEEQMDIDAERRYGDQIEASTSSALEPEAAKTLAESQDGD